MQVINVKRIPYYPILFSIYPGLSLAAHNLGQIDATDALRLALVSLLIGVVTYLTAYWLLKEWHKAAAVAVFCMALFFSYGHLYQFLENNPIGGVSLGRHRILIIAYAAALGIGIWVLVWKVQNYRRLTQAMNIACIALLMMPLLQFSSYLFQTSQETSNVSAAAEGSAILKPGEPEAMPDVYFIVLDTYIRGDALQNNFNFDNADFLDELRQMGFYVADCSRSNYDHTQPSLTSTLNMAYITELFSKLDQPSMDRAEILPLLKNSFVRQQLEAIGYRTIAFETGYAWSDLTDAEAYLQIGSDPLTFQHITPLEAMFMKTTAMLILADSNSKLLEAQFSEVNSPYKEEIDRQLFILRQLPQVASLPGAKFVYVHILLPHTPYVFAPDGSIRTDPGFTSGRNGNPIDEAHLIEGYTGEIQYLNAQILPILNQILEESKIPPVIVMMGDHGIRDENRYQILNTYYLPGEGARQLYADITPVNSFRLIFDTYFGTQYGLLPDNSYEGLDRTLIPETSPACLP
jgi:hypothetical protein